MSVDIGSKRVYIRTHISLFLLMLLYFAVITMFMRDHELYNTLQRTYCQVANVGEKKSGSIVKRGERNTFLLKVRSVQGPVEISQASREETKHANSQEST